MMIYKEIAIVKEQDRFLSVGLKAYIDMEISVSVADRSETEYIGVIKYLVDYITASGALISNNQTISFFSWIFKFVDSTNGHYSLWEANPDGTGYQAGVDYGLKVKADQDIECNRHGTKPIYPSFNQHIVISEGVYEGLSVEAVRYSSPKHMTGWWLTTDQYNDDIHTLLNVHYYHVAFKRPDILKYLALPFGYRFFTGGKETETWFDKKSI